MQYRTAIAIVIAAVVGCSWEAKAENLPHYPAAASRISLEGYAVADIDCDTKSAAVTASSVIFAKQIRRDVSAICIGQDGEIRRNYIFTMNGVHSATTM